MRYITFDVKVEIGLDGGSGIDSKIWWFSGEVVRSSFCNFEPMREGGKAHFVSGVETWKFEYFPWLAACKVLTLLLGVLLTSIVNFFGET